jgi:hypothetical protein
MLARTVRFAVAGPASADAATKQNPAALGKSTASGVASAVAADNTTSCCTAVPGELLGSAIGVADGARIDAGMVVTENDAKVARADCARRVSSNRAQEK